MSIEGRAGDPHLCMRCVVIYGEGRGILKNGDASACRLWRMCGLGGEFDVKHQT